MEHLTTIIVAIIGGVVSLLSIYVTHKLSKSDSNITSYEGDDFRENTLALAGEILDSLHIYFIKPILIIGLPAFFFIILISFLLRLTFIEHIFFYFPCTVVYLTIIFNIALNGIAKSLKSLGMSKKEILIIQQTMIYRGNFPRFFVMLIISKLLR